MARERRRFERLFQVVETAFFLYDPDAAFGVDGDARRVIPAVFQTAQAVNEKFGGFAFPCISYDTAHK